MDPAPQTNFKYYVVMVDGEARGLFVFNRGGKRLDMIAWDHHSKTWEHDAAYVSRYFIGDLDAEEISRAKAEEIAHGFGATVPSESEFIQISDRAEEEKKQIALFAAAWDGRASAIEMLLQEGASATVWRDGLTPLHLAAANGRLDAARLLIRDGAMVDAESWPLETKTIDGREYVFPVKPTLTRHSPWALVSQVTRRSFAGALGCTPLHLACDANQPGAVLILLDSGADPYLEVFLDGGIEGFWSWTPHMLARGQARASDVPHAEVAGILDTYMWQHPQSEQSKDWQRLRQGRVPM